MTHITLEAVSVFYLTLTLTLTLTLIGGSFRIVEEEDAPLEPGCNLKQFSDRLQRLIDSDSEDLDIKAVAGILGRFLKIQYHQLES